MIPRTKTNQKETTGPSSGANQQTVREGHCCEYHILVSFLGTGKSYDGTIPMKNQGVLLRDGCVGQGLPKLLSSFPSCREANGAHRCSQQ